MTKKANKKTKKKTTRKKDTDKKDDGMYFFKKDGEAWRVIKFVLSEGLLFKDSEYRIERDNCSCDGFKFRGKCRHLDRLNNPDEGLPLTLQDARTSVRNLLDRLREVFASVSLPDEPYERNDAGAVIKATVFVSELKYPSEVLSQGSWEGCLKDSGLKVRFVIQ